MDTQTLRQKLRALMDSGVKQIEIARMTGVPQGYISRFVNTDGDITFSTACKLLPLVYPDKDPIGHQDGEG